MELGRRGKISIIASKLVLREADCNLRKKSSAGAIKSFRKFLRDTKIKVVPPPDEKSFESYAEFLHPKDSPVLAAAIQSNADFLVALDRKHFFSSALFSKLKKIKIITAEDAPGLPGVSEAVSVRGSRPRAGGGDAERSRPLTGFSPPQELAEGERRGVSLI